MSAPTIHRELTLTVVIEAIERRRSSLDNPGFCVACGKECEGCEPDATDIECEHCGEPCVHGAEELLFLLS